MCKRGDGINYDVANVTHHNLSLGVSLDSEARNSSWEGKVLSIFVRCEPHASLQPYFLFTCVVSTSDDITLCVVSLILSIHA